MQKIENLKARGDLVLQVTRESGEVETFEFKNLVVDTGLNYIVSRMKDTTAGAMSHMALGSGTVSPAAGDTALGSQLGSRAALSTTTVSGNTITYSATFGAGVATGAVTEAGIFNAASSGTMLCRTVFAVVNKAANDTITVTWTVTVS